MDDVELVTEYVEFYTTLVTNTDPMLFKLQAIQDPYPLYGILQVHDIISNNSISNPADYLS
jgi:predicted lysophospholipase L1 biosynthesis ABC-type transport system permease subunit